MDNRKNVKILAMKLATVVHELMSYGLGQRNDIIIKLTDSGIVSQAEIARILGLSRQRIKQIINNYRVEK